ncbi:PREDICTED: cysteine-rich venom protein bucarin-like [Eurypyga helias]|uniref:cysteine-rich venom protein bucarin-like n=1 Tax=Eurypyga helias TaxID=54383 RepID=UPI000528D185|nr:PREDICTED: cysteine-rich venom protein bucarin-like [Eurypyga helias]
MILPVMFLCLSVVLPLSIREELELFDVLSTSKVDQQKLIADKHNTLRRGVKPTANNMQKMEWSPPAARNAQNWANHCILSHRLSDMRQIPK